MSTAKSDKKTGLGRGFDSLIPQDFDKDLLMDEHERIDKVALDRIEPSSNNPRTEFDEEALGELAESIKNYGVLQPLILTQAGQGKYTIVAGERRWRAATLAGIDKVPAIVRTTKEIERLEIALIENVQRVDLSPLEQAVSIQRLHDQFNMTYEDIADRLGKARPTVINLVRLLQLPESAKEALQDERITNGHARTLLSLNEMPDKQEELLENVVKNNWTVRQTEQFANAVHKGFRDKESTQQRMRAETPETELLSHKLDGAPVQIYRMAHGGRLEIKFRDDRNLSKILRILNGNKVVAAKRVEIEIDPEDLNV